MLKRLLLFVAMLLLAAASSACGKSSNESILYETEAVGTGITTSTVEPVSVQWSPVPIADQTAAPAETSVPSSIEPGLLLYDDFSNGYNEAFWTAELKHENFNNELQFYWPDNVFAQDGILKLRAIKEEFCGYDYTSGLISTNGKLMFKYADIEIRARYPIGKGLFAALWLAPAGEEEYLPEIDMMEVVGDVPESIWVVYHYFDFEQKKHTTGNYMDISNPDDFHTYKLEWSENSISWFIDGELVHKTSRSPETSMYLNMNLAVGGDWPGDPSETTAFPADFEIDYVKIYQNGSGQ